SFCYPEGNFGRNQLLDGSISLSPLYPNLTIDLHVRIATSLHQSFLWVHHLSGPNIHALPRIRHKRSGPGVDAPHDRDLNFHFHYALGFSTQTLAGMLDSLVRVSRRVD